MTPITPRGLYWQEILFDNGLVDLSGIGTGGLIIPGGATGQRPGSPRPGSIRYNTTTGNTEIFQNAVWADFATTVTTGFSHASNLGSGSPILATPVVLPNLTFRSLIPGTNISFVETSDSITIDSTTGGGTVTGGSNIGAGGASVFDSDLSGVLQFKTFDTTTPATMHVYNGGSSELLIDFIGTLGETNLGANLGSNSGVFVNKTGVTLNFRTLVAASSTPITVAVVSNDVQIGMASNPTIPGSASMTIPAGSTASQPSPVNGMIRYDTRTNQVRAVISGAWQTLSTAIGTFVQLGGDTMTGTLNISGAGLAITGGSISITTGSITMSAGNIAITSGNITLTSGNIALTNGYIDLNSSTGSPSAGNIYLNTGKTIDGRDPSADGLVLDRINAGTGFTARISRNTFARRTLTGTANQITISNPAGTAGSPVFAIASNPIIPGVSAMTVPVGASADRTGSPALGMLRANSDLNAIEAYNGTAWVRFFTSGGGIMSGNLVLNGGNITTTSSETIDGRHVAVDGVVIDQFNTIFDNTGVVVHTGGVFTSKLIQASASNALLGINVANGNGSGVIGIGLDITGMVANVTPNLADSIPLYNSVTSTNSKLILSDMLAFIGNRGLSFGSSSAVLPFINAFSDTGTGLFFGASTHSVSLSRNGGEIFRIGAGQAPGDVALAASYFYGFPVNGGAINVIAQASGSSAANAGHSAYSYGTTKTSFFNALSARGSANSPTVSQRADLIGAFNAMGYDGVGFATTGDASITMFADELFSGTAHGTGMAFITTPKTTITPKIHMVLDRRGNLFLGETTNIQPFGVNTGYGVLSIQNATVIPTAVPTNSVSLYSAGQSLAVMGGRIDKVRYITVAGAVTVATTDYIIVLNKSVGAATTVNLPSTPLVGQHFIIIDDKGDAGANNITITPASGNIRGSSTYVMNTNFAAVNIVFNGTQWSVF